MKIPVFHDDQHGTAIVTAAGILNGLEVVGKKIGEAKIACNGAGAAAIACLDLLVSLRGEQGQHPRLRPQGRDPRRPHRPRPVQGRLRREDRQAHPRRGDAGRRHLPRPLRQGLGDARDGEVDGAEAADLRDGEPRPRDPPRGGARGPRRRDHRHRAVGLSEPGQQRPLLPLHLPRRPRLRRHRDQRGDEARLRRGDRQHGPRRGLRRGARRLRRREPELRSRLHHPEALRPAADPRGRADRRPGGDGIGRRHPADRRHGRLPRAAAALRLPLRPADEAGLRRRRPRAAPRRLRRGRGRAGAALRPAGDPARHREADPRRRHRPDHRAAARPRPLHAPGRGRRDRRPEPSRRRELRRRPARPRRAARHLGQGGAARRARRPDGPRLPDAGARRGRRGDLRLGRPLRPPPEAARGHPRPPAGGARALHPQRHGAAAGHDLHRRRLREPRPLAPRRSPT